MQINRLFEIVYLLMNRKNITARELSTHFEVSQRTIYRDIEILCQAGIPIYTNKGKGGGICLLEHFVLNKSVLSEGEQRDILSALQGFKAASYEESNQVLTKLNSLFGNSNPDWIEVDFSYWNSNEEDKQKFYLVKDAILSQHVIEFDYYNSYGQESHRSLEPRKLIFKGQAWYLYGFCRDKKSNRFFKITRIKNLFVTQEVFIPSEAPAGIEQPEMKQEVPSADVVFRVKATMAYRIFDEFPADTITREEDQTFLIRTKLSAGSWIYGYLMSYEDQLKVEEPVWLRDGLIERYKNALSHYNMTY